MRVVSQSLMIALIVGGMLGLEPAFAQDTPATSGDPAAQSPATAVTNASNAPDDPSGASESFRETTVYIPYDKLPSVFEKQGRGVFIPYKQFQELWKAARKQLEQKEPTATPVDSLISEINSDATIGDRVVNVIASLKIEIIAKGWTTIPIRLNNSAIRKATINDEPARIIFDKKTGHQLLFNNPGDSSQVIDLKIEYTRAYSKSPGQSSVAFQAPQAPINQWRIRVPESGVTVQVEPMIAATKTPSADTPDSEKMTELLAFVGAAPTVSISWNPKAEGASGLAAFATVQTEQRVVVSEGVVRTSSTLTYDISRSTLDKLLIEVPKDEKVVNVYDRNVKRWQVEQKDDKQQIQIELFEATQGKQPVVVDLERFTDAAESSYTMNIPNVAAIGVGRQQGVVVAKLEGALQGEAQARVGLMQLDQKDLPKSLQNQPWDFAYRFGALPYELGLSIQKIVPRISVTEMIDAHLATDQLSLAWQGLYEIKDAGVFQLRVDVPEGFEIRSVHGKAIGDAKAVVVDSHHRVADDTETVLVNLSARAMGKVGLGLDLRRQLEDPNLLSPTGNASVLDIPLPRATKADVEFSQGNIVIAAPESLRVNPDKVDGLRSISFGEAYQSIAAATLPPQLRPVLAFSYATGSTDLAVSAERRRPQVIGRQLLRCEISSGAVKYDAKLIFDVKYSGVKELRIDVPADLAPDIRNVSKSIRQDEYSPAPDDLAEGYTAWKFAGETELLGTVTVDLRWQKKTDELEIGKSLDIEIPRLVPNGIDRATGQIVLSKSESIDIQPTGKPSGLRPIDPQGDLMPEAKASGAAMAFEFVGPWNLNIEAKRYELETSKRTSIDRGLVRIVDLGNGNLSVQAAYRMRSARQRLSIKLPEGAEFDAYPLRINGQAVTPERSSDTDIFAPLVDQAIDEPFVLDLRYTIPGSPSLLTLLSFPDEPAVQKVFVCVHLPERRVLLSSRGPWADEQGNQVLFRRNSQSAPAPTPDSLIDWVSEGVGGAASSIRTFHTGKSQVFIYSALQPEATPDGVLRLTTADQYLFNGLIILLVAAVGLPFFGRCLQTQIAVLLFVTVALLVLGVLFPEFARCVFYGIFPVVVVIMLLIWLAGHALKLRKLVGRTPPDSTPPPDGSPFAGNESNEANESSEENKKRENEDGVEFITDDQPNDAKSEDSESADDDDQEERSHE